MTFSVAVCGLKKGPATKVTMFVQLFPAGRDIGQRLSTTNPSLRDRQQRIIDCNRRVEFAIPAWPTLTI
jgi:hypothetical protein